jgi:hypothetical protein
MSRLKTAFARSRRIAFKRECRSSDRAALLFADNIWRCVVSHTSQGHKLRLAVDDDGQTLECVCCEMPVVQCSGDVMEAVMVQLKACGIEFEVLCETQMVE